MFGIGKILSLPVKVLNVPFRAVEKVFDSICGQEMPESDRVISLPLKALADALEEIDEEDEE